MADPNRVGGTRGPGGRTLTDIFDRLGQLVAGIGALPQLATDVAAIRTAVERMSNGTNGNLDLILTRLTYLSGSNPPSPSTARSSLYDYLVRVIGPQNQVSAIGSGDILDYLSLLGANSVITINQMEGADSVPPRNRNLLLEILTALQAGGGGGGVDYSAQLATIITELQGARADTRSIWGENLPFGWAGLSWWLERWIAAADPALPTPAFNAVVNLDRIATALASGAGDTAFSRLGSIRDNSLAILNAIGSLPSTPAGETVKTLLMDLVACCEGQSGGGQLNDPPADLCAVADGYSQKFRAVNIVPIPEWGISGEDAYAVEFGPTAQIPNISFAQNTTGSAQWYGITSNSASTAFLCYSWNLTGNNWLGRMQVRRTNAPDGAWYNQSQFDTNVAPLSIPIGNVTQSVNNNQRAGLMLILNEGTSPPPLNFWLAVATGS